MNLRALKGEIVRAYRLHGLKGILTGALAVLSGGLKVFEPSGAASTADDEFDSLYNVSTRESVRLSELDIKTENWVHGHRYEPVSMADFNNLLGELGITYEDYTFFDMGSGKGKAVLLAAMFPFMKVVGVELSDRLADISLNNVKIFRQDLIRCKGIEIVCQDASLYKIAAGSAVVFFNNPFRRNIFEKVIDNLDMNSRLILIYFNTIFDEGSVAYLESITGLTRIIESGNHVVFTTDLVRREGLTKGNEPLRGNG